MYLGKLYIMVLLTVISFALSSCSRDLSESSKNDEAAKSEFVTTDETDFEETNEDLVAVDYKEFYNALSPHGEWIQVPAKDVGIDLEKDKAAGGAREVQKFLSQVILGAPNVYAQSAEPGFLFVWKPSSDLAVSLGNTGLNVGTTVPYYQPYTNGQWMNTDNGWYFRSPTPYEEIVHHYGRWSYVDDNSGWVWLPGRVWSPAWVDWRVNDNYVAWTPVTPGIYIDGDVLPPTPLVVPTQYVVVENRYFMEPLVYNYVAPVDVVPTILPQLVPTTGVVVQNDYVYVQGPQVTVIETVIGKKVGKVKINRVRYITEVVPNAPEIYTVAPVFRKVKVTDNLVRPVQTPTSYVRIDDDRNPVVRKNQGAGKENKQLEQRNDNSGNENPSMKEKNWKEKGNQNPVIKGNEKQNKQDPSIKKQGKDNNSNNPGMKNKQQDKSKSPEIKGNDKNNNPGKSKEQPKIKQNNKGSKKNKGSGNPGFQNFDRKSNSPVIKENKKNSHNPVVRENKKQVTREYKKNSDKQVVKNNNNKSNKQVIKNQQQNSDKQINKGNKNNKSSNPKKVK